MSAYRTEFCAFVHHPYVPDWLRLGWMVVADLGPTHGEWSLLMAWICECRCVKPRTIDDVEVVTQLRSLS